MATGWNGVVVAVALSVVPSLAAFALDPAKALTQYVRRSWSVEHGLPQDSVQTISQTKDGYMWLGTQEGLVRFDGSRFYVFNSGNVPVLEANTVNCLYRDQHDTLWIAVPGQIARYADGQFTSVAVVKGLHVLAMTEDRTSNTMWFGSSTGGVYRYRAGVFARHDPDPGTVYALSSSNDGIWIGGSEGLFLHAHGKTQKIAGLDGPVLSLLAAADGVWVGSAAGLHHYDGRQVRRPIPALHKGEVWAITRDRHGTLWLGTRDGLWRWYNGTLSHLGSKDGLAHDLVDAIYEDAEGTLWVGTHLGGVTLLYDGIFVSYTRREGLSDDTIWTVTQDSNGIVWAGTERGGLNRFRDGRWSRVASSTGLHDKLITSLAADAHGGLWVGTYRSGVYHLQGNSVRAFAKKDGLPHDGITALLVDRKGLVWIGTEAGLATFDGRRFRTYTRADGLTGDRIIALCEDRDGRMWNSTSWGSGVTVFDGSRFTNVFDGAALPNKLTLAMLADRTGDLWFGTRSGVIRLHQGRMFRYTAAHEMPAGTVTQIVEDQRGNLWFACSTGLIRVQRSDLDAVLAKETGKVRSVRYGLSDGLPATELANAVFPGASLARDGRIWLATAKGVAVLDPGADAPSLRSRPLIEHVSVDAVPFPTNKPVIITPGQERIEFRYSVPTFIVQNRLRFRYRLEGFDSHWIDARDRRVAEYTNLPPGRYRFRVEVAEGERPWVAAMSMVDVHRLPAIHQTGWFVLLCVAALISAAGFAHYRRLRALRLEHELIHDERRRIALEFHDTLAHGLTGAMLQIDTALGDVQDPRAAELLHRGRTLVGSTLNEAQRVLYNLRSSTLESFDLATAIQNMVRAMTMDLAVRVSVDVVGKPRRLRDPALENHLLRIAQEAITNALRHARAQNVFVRVEFAPRKVMITVRDDGRGSGGHSLDELGAARFGIRGMQERANQIRAKLTSRTMAEGGMEIIVEVNA